MNKIKLFINQHGYKVLILFIIIVLALCVSYVLNQFARRNNLDNVSSYVESSDYGNDVELVTGEIIDETNYQSEKNLIIEFIDNCYSNPLKAYTMLGNPSKAIYDSYSSFKNQYINLYFKDKLTATPKKYRDNIYLVELREDIMQTGVINDTYIEEYISIDKKELDKVNIDSIVSIDYINSNSTFENIHFDVNYIIYKKDYAIINMTVYNENSSNINLDNTTTKKGISGILNNDLAFPYINSKTSDYNLEFEGFEKKDIDLEISFIYTNDKKINKIGFQKIKIGNEEFENIIINI